MCACLSIFLHIQLSCLLLITEPHTIHKTLVACKAVGSLITHVTKANIASSTNPVISLLCPFADSMHISLLCVSLENVQVYITSRMVMVLVTVAVHVASPIVCLNQLLC